MHKTENCLCTADFYCVHSTHSSQFFMRTERKSRLHTQYASLTTSLSKVQYVGGKHMTSCRCVTSFMRNAAILFSEYA